MLYKEILGDYYLHSEEAFAIPALAEGFVPQGLAYEKESDSFFVSGYMDRRKASPVFVIDRKTAEVKKRAELLIPDGETYRGHAGGVSVLDGYAYIAGSMDTHLFATPIAELVRTDHAEKTVLSTKIALESEEDYVRASFTSSDENTLYVGEFHRWPVFFTHRSHRADHGTMRQRAYLFGFRFNEHWEADPVCVFSIPNTIQGAGFADGYVILSQSHGLFPGTALAYSLQDLVCKEHRSVFGKEVPLYVLSEENCVKKTPLPPLPEEITMVDGKVYILFEAATNRYRIGRYMGLDNICSG